MNSHDRANNRSVLQLPYSDRQLIIVTQDEAAKAAREAERKVAVEQQGVDWAKIGELTFRAIFPLGDLIADVTKEAIKAWERARASGIQVIPVGKSETAKITFPPGHPREGCCRLVIQQFRLFTILLRSFIELHSSIRSQRQSIF